MARILVVAEHDGKRLNASTAKCVACATGIEGADIHVAVFAEAGEAVAAEAARLSGTSKVIQVDNPANAYPLAAVLAPQVAQLAGAYTHVLGPSTTFGRDLMPRVAALLDVNQITDIMQALGSHTFKRPIYAGNAIVTVEAAARKQVVGTVRMAS